MRKIQVQGVHHTTIVGSTRQSALDFCRGLKDNPSLNWMPVMFSTKTITKDTVEKVYAAGADEFVGWPCQPRVRSHMVFPIQVHLSKCKLQQLR